MQYGRNDNKREVWLDVLRAFACFSVLLCHAPAEYGGITPGKRVLGPLTYVTMSTGVSVFIMISGALLLYKPQPMVFFL